MKNNQQNYQNRSAPRREPRTVRLLSRDPIIAPIIQCKELLKNGEIFMKAQGLSEAEIKKKQAPLEKELAEMLALRKEDPQAYYEKYVDSKPPESKQ